MKILVVTQYFAPEPGAPSNRLLAFVETMVRRGHEVTVICEFPNYPAGILARKDRWRLFRVEKNHNYTVIRTLVFPFVKKNNIKRMVFYLSFAVSSFIAGVLIKRHDIVFSSSPPIFHVLSAMLVSKLKRSRFVLDIRDIWPDSAIYIEAVKNERLLRWGRALEKKLYDNAEMIFTVSNGLSETIASRGGKGKVHVCYNGSNEDMLTWKGNTEEIRNELGWNGKFVVAYAGLMGLGQNLVELLDHIKEISNDSIKFVFVGDGPDKRVLEDVAKEKNCGNLTFLDLMPRHRVVELTHAADIMIVILRETDFFKSAIPSKFFDSMAAGKPVVSNVDGELREFIEKYNTGIYFSYRKENSFKDAIMRLYEDSDLRDTMGSNGKKLIAEKFLRKILAEDAVKYMEGK